MLEPGGHRAADWPQAWLRRALGIESTQRALYAQALTHRSAAGPHNERLEFLGDAVLNMVVAQHLYQRFAQCDEGALSRLRASVVSERPLAEAGARFGIGVVLHLGSGELRTGGFRRESILADAVEALIGARYLDAGLEAAAALVHQLLAEPLAQLDPLAQVKDAKTRLQEWLQGRGLGLPGYELDRAEGEPHAQTFWVRCAVVLPDRPRVLVDGQELNGRTLRSEGVGSSRRRAEQAAAEQILAQLQGVSG